MLNPHSHAPNLAVVRDFIRCQVAATRFFLGLGDGHAGNRKALKPQILVEDTPDREDIRFAICHRFIVPGAFVAGTQKADAAIVGNQQQIFERMLFLLPTVVEALFIGVTRPGYWPFRSIVKKKVVPSACAATPASASSMSAWRSGSNPSVAKARLSTACST